MPRNRVKVLPRFIRLTDCGTFILTRPDRFNLIVIQGTDSIKKRDICSKVYSPPYNLKDLGQLLIRQLW